MSYIYPFNATSSYILYFLIIPLFEAGPFSDCSNSDLWECYIFSLNKKITESLGCKSFDHKDWWTCSCIGYHTEDVKKISFMGKQIDLQEVIDNKIHT